MPVAESDKDRHRIHSGRECYYLLKCIISAGDSMDWYIQIIKDVRYQLN